MAVFGNIKVVKKEVDYNKFKKAFSYLQKVFNVESTEYRRLISLPLDAFEKIELDKDNFALEQAYMTKEREDCFFESHKKYIDVQFILEGEEIIEVADKNDLVVRMHYREEMDLIKYDIPESTSLIRLKKGDVAIFYPEDAHMPCVKIHKPVKVIKTVIKVAV